MTSSVYQRVLLVTEHGEFDAGAERMAIAVASAMHASLHVALGVAINAEVISSAPELLERAEQEAARAIAELTRLAADQRVPMTSSMLQAQDLAEAFAQEARRHACDLMVVRRRGRRGWLSRLLVGEMVERLIDRSPCDVLIAPRTAQMWTHGVLALTSPEDPRDVAMQKGGRLASAASLPVSHAALGSPAAQQAIAGNADLVVTGMPVTQLRRVRGLRQELIGAAQGPVLLCLSG